MNGAAISSNAFATLQAAQAGIGLVTQNVGGQSVDGFARRTLGASVARFVPNGASGLGTGVSIEGFSRSWSQLLQQQRVQQAGVGAMHQTVVDGLKDLDVAAADTATALDAPVNDFFAALAGLARDPSNPSLLDALAARGQALLSAADQFRQGVDAVRRRAIDGLQAGADEANRAAEELAAINREIAVTQSVSGPGPSPAVLDRRDLLLQRLGTLVGGSLGIDENGQAYAFVDGQPLVNGGDAAVLALSAQPDDPAAPLVLTMEFRQPGASAVVRAALDPDALQGRLGGQWQLTAVPAALADAGNPAVAPLVALFEAVDGRASGSNRATDALAAIGAWQTGQSSRGEVDAALRGLVPLANAGDEGASGWQAELLDGWRGFTSTLGTLVSGHAGAASASQAVQTRLDDDWQATSGVNLDEEAANLLQYQQLFNAASRLLQANAQMLDGLMAVINR